MIKKKPFPGVIVGIVIITAIVYFVQLQGIVIDTMYPTFTVPDLIALGKLSTSKVLAGEWWRLITNVFLHSGEIHLLNNLLPIATMGLFLEYKMGHLRFLLVYLGITIFASGCFMATGTSQASIGASGVYFGLLVVFLMYFREFITKNFSKTIYQGLFIIMVLSIGYEIYAKVMYPPGNTASAMHLGGYAAGIIIGTIYSIIHHFKKED